MGVLVAPHAGAWIETLYILVHIVHLQVAPHAGAWIETPDLIPPLRPFMSHPMRVRGLKLVGENRVVGKLVSHPMRVRGLKLN